MSVAQLPYVPPAPDPRRAWSRYRVVMTVEVDARDVVEAQELALDAVGEGPSSGEVTELAAIETPAPLSAHPEAWREALLRAAEPDDWNIQSVLHGEQRWLTDAGIALVLPRGVAQGEPIELLPVEAAEGNYAAATLQRSTAHDDGAIVELVGRLRSTPAAFAEGSPR